MLKNFIFFQVLKKKNNKYRPFIVNTAFFKRPKIIKFSFLFFYLIKKKNIFFNKNIDFFYFSNIYLIFFKKIIELLFIFKKDIIFSTDIYCENLGNINSLNLYLKKKNYIFFKLKNYNYLFIDIEINNEAYFYFLFIKQSTIKYVYLYNPVNACPIIDYSLSPTFFNFFLPVIVDFNFSIIFYKFFFFSFLTKKA